MKSTPKYNIGQRLVCMNENPKYTLPLDDNFIVSSEGSWHIYEEHPNGGYWEYGIEGKENDCPEDFLTPFIEGQLHYLIQLPCHIYFIERNKNNKE